MARGITQEQVNAAADTILGTGENPTVEKVRAELGTGSPNTVTRMLDTWRSQLGERLRQLSALPEVPTPLGQAMMTLWQLATEHAGHAIAGRYAEERAALEAARGALAAERDAWAVRLEVAENDRAQALAAKDLAEHACNTLDAQLQDSHALRTDLIQQRDRLQSQCDQLAVELQGLRAQSVEQQQAAAAERARQEAYLRNLEDRAHQEVDRLRQESKRWQQRLDAAECAHRDAETALRTEIVALRDLLRGAEKEVARYAGQVAGLEKALSEHAVSKRKAARPGRVKRPARSKTKQT
ncbi:MULTISPECIES: DNA-binding protein [Rhodanobacter]|uniref:DNA-binding protein n=1 Tax=Rhodanobacter TaxID=75309 RepID=UPI0004289D92|nr:MULTISPECIES: DNA-binding protein [Rhodanobacter]UJJ52655.1 DNA-binding protein [Rhodanobacter denitrificans]UJM95408.1 DNA-binding protein [Rhodanobacter denitrificans]UJM98939.1 DNA-binding protein [Rhodanobacter denitrificans]UJN21646.1 DNA-binding protein [Rhodanobacter denitrificans]